MIETGFTDKNNKEILAGHIVSFLDMTGKVVFESGAFGIGFEDDIVWDAVQQAVCEYTGYCNKLQACFNDHFISFYEIIWNFNIAEDSDTIDLIEIIGDGFNGEYLSPDQE